jgi:hypothetical protein
MERVLSYNLKGNKTLQRRRFSLCSFLLALFVDINFFIHTLSCLSLICSIIIIYFVNNILKYLFYRELNM